MKANTPILVANTEWPLPETLISDVKQERMINGLINMIEPLTPEESVGWAELVAYLLPATYRSTLNSKVTKIYLYCVGKLLEGKNKKIDIDLPKQLDDYELKQLDIYKRWIYKERGGQENNPVLSALKEVFMK